MFSYKDPGGTLKPAKALANYRQFLHEQYRTHAKSARSAYAFLEAFAEMAAGASPKTEAVTWLAFPITASASNTEIDANRFRFQDEYCEWRVERAANKVRSVTFTTDFLEYYQAIAMVGVAELIAAVKAVMPSANPKAAELFGPGADPATISAESRSARFRNFAQENPWNNGTKGILCLAQQFNTLGALFNLVGPAAVVNNSVPAGQICGTMGGLCGPNRNSDPSIATYVQEQARQMRGLSLHDPAGIEIMKLQGIWKRGNTQIDINDPAGNGGVWALSRSGRRGVLKVAANLTVDDEPISSGAQVASRLQVQARITSAAEAQLPEWARVGQEDSVRNSQVAVAGGA